VSPTLEIALEKLQIRSPIGDADRAAFLALPFRVRTLEPSSYIIREGDAPTQCAVLLSGFAYRQKLAADGGRQIIGVHIPGDILDLQNLYLSVSDHGVQTLMVHDDAGDRVVTLNSETRVVDTVNPFAS